MVTKILPSATGIVQKIGFKLRSHKTRGVMSHHVLKDQSNSHEPKPKGYASCASPSTSGALHIACASPGARAANEDPWCWRGWCLGGHRATALQRCSDYMNNDVDHWAGVEKKRTCVVRQTLSLNGKPETLSPVPPGHSHGYVAGRFKIKYSRSGQLQSSD